MITDKYDRFILFGSEIDEQHGTIQAGLGFYETNLPASLVLYSDRNYDEPLGEYVLPPELAGQMFEGIITSVTLRKKQ